MKQIKVKLLGSTIEPFATYVAPGDTAGEVLARINLAGYVLRLPFSFDSGFASDELVYDELREGDVLLAVPEPVHDCPPKAAISSDDAREELKRLLRMADDEQGKNGTVPQGDHPMKGLTIRVQGSQGIPVEVQIFTAQIRPGTRACDILHALKLGRLVDFYVLKSAADLMKGFPDEEELYSNVDDGDELIALPIHEAARLIYETWEGIRK